MRVSILILITLVLFAGAFGQSSGSIKGTVVDLRGAPIAEAIVYGVDQQNIKHRITTTTDSAGQFTFDHVRPGTYELRAFKENEGYADTFFAFFYAGNDKNWARVTINAGKLVKRVLLQLGPKYAKLKLSIVDEKGNSVGAGVWFTKPEDVKRIYGVGVAPEPELLVPPVPFRFEIEKKGYETWRSDIIKPRSGQLLSLRVNLRPTH